MEKRTKHLKKSLPAEVIGWIGAFCILLSYGLLSFGIIPGQSYVYHLLVGIGSIGLAVVTYRHKAFQSVLVNSIFTIFAVIALIRLLLIS